MNEKVNTIVRNTKIYNIDDAKMKSCQALFKAVECKMETVMERIKFENDSRCLHAFSKGKTAAVKLPTFSGGADEDFSKFKRDVIKGFKTNKVRRDDQTRTLRECLVGHPKHLIPIAMINIEDAWNVLISIYGDPSRVMAAKKKKILEMEEFPKDKNSAKALKKQVEWLMLLKITLQDIIELGDDDEEMQKEAFSGSMITAVRSLFPFKYLAAISKLKGTGREKMFKIVEYVVDLRENRQEMMKSADQTTGVEDSFDETNECTSAEDSFDTDKESSSGEDSSSGNDSSVHGPSSSGSDTDAGQPHEELTDDELPEDPGGQVGEA